MADAYLNIKGIACVSGKVDRKYAEKAKAAAKKAIEKTAKAGSGATTAKPSGKAAGYSIDLTIAEIAVAAETKTVTVKVNGILSTYPEGKMVSSSLSGSAKVSGDISDGAVVDGIASVVEDMMVRRVIPAIKKGA